MKLSYAVCLQGSTSHSQAYWQKKATRVPRRQLHQVVNDRHTSFSVEVPAEDFLIYLEHAQDFQIEQLIHFSERRAHWVGRGLDLVPVEGRTAVAAGNLPRDQLVDWLKDLPNREIAAQYLSFLISKFSLEDFIWIMKKLGDDPRYARVYSHVNNLSPAPNTSHAEFRSELLAWIDQLKNPVFRKVAYTTAISDWMGAVDVEPMAYVIKHLRPEDLGDVDELWEEPVPSDDRALQLLWWLGRESVEGEGYAIRHIQPGIAPHVIPYIFKIRDVDIQVARMSALFRVWDSARVKKPDAYRADLYSMVQAWTALNHRFRIATVESLVSTYAYFEPKQATKWVSRLNDGDIRALGQKALRASRR